MSVGPVHGGLFQARIRGIARTESCGMDVRGARNRCEIIFCVVYPVCGLCVGLPEQPEPLTVTRVGLSCSPAGTSKAAARDGLTVSAEYLRARHIRVIVSILLPA